MPTAYLAVWRGGYGFLSPFASISFACVFLCGLEVLAPKDWSRSPKLQVLEDSLEAHSCERLTHWVGQQYKIAVAHNEEMRSLKAKNLQYAAVGIGIEGFSVFAFGILVVVT